MPQFMPFIGDSHELLGNIGQPEKLQFMPFIGNFGNIGNYWEILRIIGRLEMLQFMPFIGNYGGILGNIENYWSAPNAPIHVIYWDFWELLGIIVK